MRIVAVGCGVVLLFYGYSAWAQDYPTKPIRLVIASSPGGSTTTLARTIGEKLSGSLKQQIVADNRAGAGGIVAGDITARAAPDGYTLLFSTSAAVAVSVSLYKKLPYDPVKAFAPVTLVAVGPYMLVVHPSLCTSVKELIALARAKPGQISFASTGVGTASHLSGELFKSAAGVNILHIPYRSMTSAMIDVISGQASLAFSSIISGLPQAKAGRVKALAVTGAKRLLVAPELPTISEAGVPGYESKNWYGILAPAGTPRKIVDLLNKETLRVLSQADVQERLSREGLEPLGNSPEEFGAYIKSETVKWAKVIKAAGIHPE